MLFPLIFYFVYSKVDISGDNRSSNVTKNSG